MVLIMIPIYHNVLHNLIIMFLFNQVGFDKSAMINMYSVITVDISSDCVCDTSCYLHIVTTAYITGTVKHMKSDKSDSFDGLTSDYLKNGSPLLFYYLSLLVTYMLHHSFFTFNHFYMSTMIHIPKISNKDLSKLQNYRVIALSSLLSKVLNHCIYCQSKVLESHNLQFAYKSGTSTTQCVSAVTETVNYY